MTLTQKRLKALLIYSPKTGQFTWREARGSKSAGALAGVHCARRGYVLIRVDGILYLAHRLAWLYMKGAWPSREVDHRNRIADDNRWSNLRLATKPQNGANSSLSVRNSSGVKGVCRIGNRWRAYVTVNRKQIPLGCYDTLEEAALARKKGAAKYHGEFAT
jgi:hypothetical protein